MKQQHFLFCAVLSALIFPSLWADDATTNAGLANAAKNDVTWTALGKNENDSMPVGNGDIGLNAWTEANGDIVLLAGKDDAWSENGELLKLGRVRIKLSPNPFTGSSFSQTLKLETGELVLEERGDNYPDLGRRQSSRGAYRSPFPSALAIAGGAGGLANGGASL